MNVFLSFRHHRKSRLSRRRLSLKIRIRRHNGLLKIIQNTVPKKEENDENQANMKPIECKPQVTVPQDDTNKPANSPADYLKTLNFQAVHGGVFNINPTINEPVLIFNCKLYYIQCIIFNVHLINKKRTSKKSSIVGVVINVYCM